MPSRAITAGLWFPRALGVAALIFVLAVASGAPALAAPESVGTVAPTAAPAAAAPAGRASTPATIGADGRPRVHAVVLVDESGSEGPLDVRQQADAASLIATSGQVDPSSQVAVVGFGTDDYPEKSSQRHGATDEACPLAPVNSTDFRTCLSRLHKRTPEEGNGTDHSAALTKALDILDAHNDKSFFNLVFLLTDGGLRVDNVARYGARQSDPVVMAQLRNDAARAEVEGPVSARAKALDAQIWPVGFGRGLDADWMRKLATFGAGVNPFCEGVPVAAPSYSYAQTAADVSTALDQALANASCQHFENREDDGGPGKPVTLSLNIPITASTATINAVKRDPRIQVAYVDPRGNQMSGRGARDGSTFSVSASAEDTESLFVANPYPGTWKVTFTWPAGVSPQRVQAHLTWFGQLSSLVRMEPSSPRPGQPAKVEVRLHTSRGAPIDPQALRELTFDAELGGDGFSPVPVPLLDSGQGGDTRAGDGTFTGVVTVPSTATGLLTLTGSVHGRGLRGTVQSADYRIPGLRSGGVALELPAVGSVHRGTSLDATLRADNPEGSPREMRVQLQGLPGVSVTPTSVTVPAGVSGFSAPLHLTVAPDAAYGRRSGIVRLVDPAGTAAGVVLEEKLLAFDLKAPTPVAEKYWYLLVLAVAAVALLVAGWLLLRARRARAADVSALMACASRGGVTAADLPAPRNRSSVFRFVLRDQPGRPVTLEFANPGDGTAVYTVRRTKHGQLAVTTPTGQTRTDPPGTRIPVGSGVALWVDDRRLHHPTDLGRPDSTDPWAGGSPAGAGNGFGGLAQDPFGADTQTVDPFATQPGGRDPFGGYSNPGPHPGPHLGPHPGGNDHGAGGGNGGAEADSPTLSEAPTLQRGVPPRTSPSSDPWGDDWGSPQL
ncbi:vWA domain-containing protein [Frankia sp. AgB32]|uniref:vWA domain-containing protein n=1 Tax=Frankia sp. AgB32 TaxID=631119 RepID=UPI00200E4D4F|nr:vWA domain-containing protein [Frankia sp. AgB32]MCK9896900.1 VWA domain-containing protein [Frankia sp. AgB32]